MRERLYYAVLWIIAVIAISIPWSTANGETFTGWHYVAPFSSLYVIGLMLGLIVLLTKAHPFGLSLAAGILMFFGVIGGMVGAALIELTEEFTGKTAELSVGIEFAFLWSIVFIVAGPILGGRMAEMEER